MATIIYSFNKTGFELGFWQREIAAASTGAARFVPINHGDFLGPQHYSRAQLLDNLWFAKDQRLIAMYDALRRLIERENATALVVDNANPYHPEFLRTIDIHKVMRTSDGPTIAYDRDIPYVHAFDQILYHSRAYSPELTMPEKLAYVGAKRTDFWPLGLFDAGWRVGVTEDELVREPRDIDVLFVGALHLDKMPLLARVKKAFGRRCRIHGLTSLKKNIYFKAKYRAPGWVRPISFEEYIPLYRRAKIGFNVHLRGDYTVGGYRLFELPANGVMQISDGGCYLDDFYEVGSEIEGYASADDLISKIDYFLTHEAEREARVRAAFRRTMRDHRIGHRMKQLAALVADGKVDRGLA
jgi:spore maturation protein CgeB